METLIYVKNLKKYYGSSETKVKALDDVSFDIYKGELLVVVGNSGCGKSTLLNMIGGMDTVTDGEIILNGEDITKYSEKELTKYRRNKIGFVFQFYNLLPDLTALENVKLTLPKTSKDEVAIKALKSVGLENRLNSYPSQLSGGEQQRVSIARALVNDSELILCDEPTGALDDKTGKSILMLLESLARCEHKTILIVTHTSEIGKIADRVIHMRDGKIESIEGNNNIVNAKDIEW